MASLNPFTGVLGTRRAAHLLRRTTFGPTRKQIETFATKTCDEAVDELFNIKTITSKPLDPLTAKTWVDDFRKPENSDESFLKRYVISWWLDNAYRDDTVLHKCILFLHQNWITNYTTVDSAIYYDYLKLIEFYATGNYKTLAKKMCFNNSMLSYLNGRYSFPDSPIEDYAREFLELFTIGKENAEGGANYTEDDIKLASSLFTGYKMQVNNDYIDPETGIRAGSEQYWRHDVTDKTFSSHFQNVTITGAKNAADMYREVDDFVALVFSQNETAKNICRKMYRFFVHPNITSEVESDIISPLSSFLMEQDYQIGVTLQKLLKSKHFFDEDDANKKDEIIGAKIKSPLDLLFGTMRFFDIHPPNVNEDIEANYYHFYRKTIQDFFLENTGFRIFKPDNVAGYTPYYQQPDFDRLWINSSSIVARYTLPKMFLENKKVILYGDFYASFDILTWVNNPENISNPADGTVLVDEMIRYLFPENPFGTERFNFFLNEILLGGLSLRNWQMEWNNYKSTGVSDSVLPQLKSLFISILYSQEYQLH
ncbi:MAG: DUF1800 family protein [Agriterribacter sp.]